MWGLTRRERVLDFFLPRTCAACKEDLPPPLSGPLCGRCLSLLRRAPRRAAGRLLPSGLVRAAFAYRHPVPGLLHAFKYRGRESVGRALADWMAGAWMTLPEFGRPDLFVPVPLHPRRRRERGFNQSMILAAGVSRAARIPALEALRRVRSTAPRARADPASRGSLADAFAAAPGADLRGARVVLIDDVCTTGGTLAGCAQALLRGGAVEVQGFVLATAVRD